MKNIQTVLSVTTKDTVQAIAEALGRINEAHGLLRVNSAQSAAPRTVGPMEKKWKKFAGVTRVRATGERDHEEQALFNFRKHGFSDEDIAKIKG